MLQLLIYFFVGIGLSMDTFSLSISLGTTNPSLKKVIETSLLVGLFHFFMPILGSIIGIFLTPMAIKGNLITGIIFLFLAIQMYLSRNNEEKIPFLNFLNQLLFAFTVSIDSFSVGIAFGITRESVLISSSVFLLVSTLFTGIGLLLGRFLATKSSKISLFIGISILIIIGLKYIFIA